ncbi:hypothetical protein ACROYT_G015315 [Oculina patagonica]
MQSRSQSNDKTPAGPTNSKRTSAPRRGSHFQSAVAESSDEEIDEEVENNSEQIDIISDHAKAKTTEDVENNRPAAGILEKTLATEYKVL